MPGQKCGSTQLSNKLHKTNLHSLFTSVCEMYLVQLLFQINLKLFSAEWPDSSWVCAVEESNCMTENNDQSFV